MQTYHFAYTYPPYRSVSTISVAPRRFQCASPTSSASRRARACRVPPFSPLNPWTPKRPAYCASPLLRKHRRRRVSPARARHVLVAPARRRFSTRDNTARRAARNAALSCTVTTQVLRAPLARKRSLRCHRGATATAVSTAAAAAAAAVGVLPVRAHTRYSSATLNASVCRFLRCLQARNRPFAAARTMNCSVALPRTLARPASCAARRQTRSPCFARTRSRHASSERDSRVRATHAQKARRRRSWAALRRCQRLTATIATAALSIVSVKLGPRRRSATSSHRLALAAALTASSVAFAARHFFRATRFANVDARTVRE